MIARICRLCAVAAAVLLCLTPLFSKAALTRPLGHEALFTASPAPASIGVYAIVLLSALAGIGTRARPIVTALFVCALVAAFADARFAFVLAAVSAPVLVKARAS